jgi:hypothetical protein
MSRAFTAKPLSQASAKKGPIAGFGALSVGELRHQGQLDVVSFGYGSIPINRNF